MSNHGARVSAGALKNLDPEFRKARARKAAAASNSGDGVITRLLNKLGELTPEQIETVRRALPPQTATTRDGDGPRVA
jgi:hypothetical protein